MVIRDRIPVQLILVEREFTFRVQFSLVNETQLGKKQTSEAAADSSCLSVAAEPFVQGFTNTLFLFHGLSFFAISWCWFAHTCVSYLTWACCSVHSRTHLDELLHAFLFLDCEFQILREESGWSATHSKCLIPWDQEWEHMIKCLFFCHPWWCGVSDDSQFSGKGS